MGLAYLTAEHDEVWECNVCGHHGFWNDETEETTWFWVSGSYDRDDEQQMRNMVTCCCRACEENYHETKWDDTHPGLM